MSYSKPFATCEYEQRVNSVKQSMQAAGFDLLICQDPASMNWLTGFDGWSFYTPQAVLVHLDEAAPIWFGRAQDAKSARITTDLPDANIVGFSEPLVHHPTQHPFDELCALIIARGWGTARIGVELNAHYYTARAHQHITSGLPDARISDNRELVNWARLVKSEAVLKRNGYRKDSRVGYSIGLNYPPDWGERTASLRPGDDTVLQAGMCFHFQSGMWLDDFGAAISEPFVVTANGGERLSHVARELIITD